MASRSDAAAKIARNSYPAKELSRAEEKEINTRPMEQAQIHTFTRQEALETTQDFWTNFTLDPVKNLLLYLWNSGHAFMPNFNRIVHGDPAMAAASWPPPTTAASVLAEGGAPPLRVDPLLRDLLDSVKAQTIGDDFKVERLLAYQDRVSLVAELPSCSCCGIRNFPDEGGTEHPLTCATGEDDSFVTLPITDPRFDALKLTDDQRTDRESDRARGFRTVYAYRRDLYHLYPHLLLPGPAAPHRPEPCPYLVVCSACLSKLPSPAGGAASAAADPNDSPDQNESDNETPDSESAEASRLKNLPKYSVAAGFEYGQLKDMPPLTFIEATIVAKAIVFGCVIKLKEFRGVSQRGITGQLICFPHDGPQAAASLAEHRNKTQFPFHTNQELADYCKVSFVGPEDQAKNLIKVLMMPNAPLCYKSSNITTWLRVLNRTHPNYSDIEIPTDAELDATLAPLHQLIVAQTQIVSDETSRLMDRCKVGTDIAAVRDSDCGGGQVDSNNSEQLFISASDEDVAATSADAAPPEPIHLDASGLPDQIQLVMNNCVIVDSHAFATDPDQTLLDAVNKAAKTPPSDDGLVCRRSAIPFNEFEDGQELLVCAFPHCFPFGVGVPPSSATSPTFTRFLMLHHTNTFSNEQRLQFLLFNQLHRQTNARSTSMRVKASKVHVDAVNRVTQRSDFRARLEAANSSQQSADAKSLLAELRPHIFVLGAHAPYSDAARKSSFNHLMAANNRFGMPMLFITMAFNDVSNTLAIRLSFPSKSNEGFPAQDCGLQDQLLKRANDFDGRDRNLDQVDDMDLFINLDHRHNLTRISNNPVAAALYFKTVFNAILEVLLKVPQNLRKTIAFHTSERKGIFGNLTDYNASLEAAQKGTLHFHSNATGVLSPAMLGAVAHSPLFMENVSAVFDSMISASLPPARLLEHIVAERFGTYVPNQPDLGATVFANDVDIRTINDLSSRAAASTRTSMHLMKHTDSCVRCGNPCCRYAKPSGMTFCTCMRMITIREESLGETDLREDDFQATLPSERPLRDYTRDPIEPLDDRPLVFEMKRPVIHLTTSVPGPHDTDSIDFDLERDFLGAVELGDMHESVKNKIRSLSAEEQNTVKHLLFKSNGWVAEFNSILMAVADCNMAVYPLGTAATAKATFMYVTKYICKDPAQICSLLSICHDAAALPST